MKVVTTEITRTPNAWSVGHTQQGLAIAAGPFDTSILAGTKSPNTVDQYKIHFAAYVAFAGSFGAALQPTTLALWRQSLYTNGYSAPDGAQRPYSVGSINLRLASVRGLLTEAAQQGYITHELAEQFKHIKGLKQVANKERRKANARTPISPEQMRQIVKQPNSRTLAGKMHAALLKSLAGCGMRISEAVMLRRADIRWEVNDDTGKAGWVADIAGKNKVEAQPRPLDSEAYKAIQTWLQARSAAGVESDYVFTSFAGRGDSRINDRPLNRVSAWGLVKRYAEQAGCQNVKPHDLRRFVGTQLAKKDIRIAQKQLGHARIETTAAHYVLDGVHVGATEGLY